MVVGERVGRAERSEQVRAALMAAAREEFLARGYHGASLDHIAAVAGFTKGVVYSRFASKADLFLALLEERIEARAAQNRRLLDAAGHEGLPALAQRWTRQQRDDLAWSLLVLEFRVHAARHPEVNERYAELHEGTLAGIAEVVSAVADLPPAEARVLGQAIFALGNGAVLEQAVDPAAMDEHAAAEHTRRLMGGT